MLIKIRLVMVLILLLVVLGGCSESKQWKEALNETTPPNPEETRGVPESERLRARQGKSNQNQTAEDQENNLSNSQTSSADNEATDSEKTSLLLTLNAFPSCHNGAVRLYINRKFMDVFNDEGTLEIVVSPGTLDVEIWDSGGSWKFQVNARRGLRNEVSVNCDNKRGFGNEG